MEHDEAEKNEAIMESERNMIVRNSWSILVVAFT